MATLFMATHCILSRCRAAPPSKHQPFCILFLYSHFTDVSHFERKGFGEFAILSVSATTKSIVAVFATGSSRIGLELEAFRYRGILSGKLVF